MNLIVSNFSIACVNLFWNKYEKGISYFKYTFEKIIKYKSDVNQITVLYLKYKEIYQYVKFFHHFPCYVTVSAKNVIVVVQLLGHFLLFLDPMEYCCQQGCSVRGISQARILEWASISFSRGSFWPRDQAHISCICRQVLYHWATREL